MASVRAVLASFQESDGGHIGRASLPPEGKAKQKYTTLGYYATRKEALLALSEYHRNPLDLSKKDLTFADIWALWSPAYFKRTPSSKNGLTAAFKRCAPLHGMPLKSIRKAHLQEVLDGMSSMSEQSQKKVKTVYKMTYQYALENDLIAKDYSAFVTIAPTKRPADAGPKFFSSEELRRVLESPEDSVLILLYTGMRIGELLGVKCEDVRLDERLIHVRGTKTKNADRLVPIHRDLLPILARSMGGEYLIQEHRTYNAYTRKVFNPYLEALGISHTPHATRHTFVSLMDKGGANPLTLKRIVGHSNASMTEHYSHREAVDLLEAIDCLTFLRHS